MRYHNIIEIEYECNWNYKYLLQENILGENCLKMFHCIHILEKI